MKRFAKKWLYGQLTPRRRELARRRRAGLVLCYHRFESKPGVDPVPGMAITPDRFRMHVETLRKMGTIVPFENLLREPSDGGLRFCLTFDDGYRDNLTVLVPLLEELDVSATLFVVGGILDGSVPVLSHDASAGHSPELLRADDIRILAAHPLVHLGAHTMTHPRLATLGEPQIRQEVRESRLLLETLAQKPIIDFAAPYGQPRDADWALTAEVLEREGYRTLLGNSGGWNVPGLLAQGGFCRINRISMSGIAEAWNVEAWVLAQAMKRRV